MKDTRSLAVLLALAGFTLGANFSLVADYSGNGFFDQWTFYGNFDNLTNGAFTLSSPPRHILTFVAF